MNNSIGYPSFIWTMASFISVLGDRGDKSFRLACILQGLFNLGFLYFVFQIGISLMGTSSIMIINGFDISPIFAIIVILFGLYLSPLMLYSGIVIPLIMIFSRGAPYVNLYYTVSEEEISALINDFFYESKNQSKLLDLLIEEERETIKKNKVSVIRRKEDKKGKYLELHYRERIGYELNEV